MRAILLSLIVICTAMGGVSSQAGDSVFIQISLNEKSVFTDAIHLGNGSYVSSDQCLLGIWPADTGLLPVDPQTLDILIYDPPSIQYSLLNTDPAAFIESLGDSVGTCTINMASPKGYIRYTSTYSSSDYSIMSGLFSGFACVGMGLYLAEVTVENVGPLNWLPWNQGALAVVLVLFCVAVWRVYADIAKPAGQAHIKHVTEATEAIKLIAADSAKNTEINQDIKNSLASISTQLSDNCKYPKSGGCNYQKPA